MWHVPDVACSGCEMFGMWDVWDVGCSECVMSRMWDVRDVGCSGCRMFGMWDVRDVGCSGCGMFAGMWDVDLQNAFRIMILLKMPCQNFRVFVSLTLNR